MNDNTVEIRERARQRWHQAAEALRRCGDYDEQKKPEYAAERQELDEAYAAFKALPADEEALEWLSSQEFPTRLHNCVHSLIVDDNETLDGLRARSDAEWLRVPNLGMKSLKALRSASWPDRGAPVNRDRLNQEHAKLVALSDDLEAKGAKDIARGQERQRQSEELHSAADHLEIAIELIDRVYPPKSA